MRETLHIRDDLALAGLVERLKRVSRLALDTEFLRERTYYPKLCLLQLATADVLALVDPLAVRDLSPLWEVLVDGPEIVLHAAAQDLEIVQRDGGGVPSRWFDTQVAAAFLGYGDSIGYSRLVERVLGQSPKHAEAYTDWSRRPLTSKQSEYALDDVRYLLECADHMRQQLEQRERAEWVREEIQILDAKARNPLGANDQWRRVSGARRLSGQRLAILREATAWRERAAQKRDIPRQRVIADRVLVEIARRAPKRQSEVERLRGLHPREAERSAAAIIQAVRRAEALAQEHWPAWPSTPPHSDDPGVEALVSFLDAFVRMRANELELSPRLIAPRQDLARVVRLAASDALGDESAKRISLLRGWRFQSVGAEMLALLQGEGALRVIDGNRLVRQP